MQLVVKSCLLWSSFAVPWRQLSVFHIIPVKAHKGKSFGLEKTPSSSKMLQIIVGLTESWPLENSCLDALFLWPGQVLVSLSVPWEFCSSSSLMIIHFASTGSLQTILMVLLVGFVFYSAVILCLESGLVIPDGSPWLGYFIILHGGGWELIKKSAFLSRDRIVIVPPSWQKEMQGGNFLNGNVKY